MKSSKIILPARSLELIITTIEAFLKTSQPISAKDLAIKNEMKFSEQTASLCCQRLVEMGILSNELNSEYKLTPLGNKLANAITTNPNSEQHTRLWQEAVNNVPFYKQLIEYLINGNPIKRIDLGKEINSRIGSPEKKLEGAYIVIDILEKTKLIKFEHGRRLPDAMISANPDSLNYPPDLKPFLKHFHKDHPDPSKCAFVMMKFEDTALQRAIFEAVKSICFNYGISVLRADGKEYSNQLLANVRTYMHGCGFGIAIFDRINSEFFNPNVSFEVGYLMAMNRDVLILKDKTLNSLHTDLMHTLYKPFDTQNLKKSLDPIIKKWLQEKSYIENVI